MGLVFYNTLPKGPGADMHWSRGHLYNVCSLKVITSHVRIRDEIVISG